MRTLTQEQRRQSIKSTTEFLNKIVESEKEMDDFYNAYYDMLEMLWDTKQTRHLVKDDPFFKGRNPNEAYNLMYIRPEKSLRGRRIR